MPLLTVITAGLGSALTAPLFGQTFANLHSFGNGTDGSNPYGSLVLSSNTVYGTTSGVYDVNDGTVFAVNSDGTGFVNLHSFGGSDGTTPYAGLTISGNTLYGTTWQGGSFYNGTVFRANTDGTGFRIVHSFSDLPTPTNSDGANPMGSLVVSGDTLYGTANGGGNYGAGTVFAVNSDGTRFTTLHSFTATDGNGANSDGAYPVAGLVLSADTLYGTSQYGGSSGYGTVFKITTNGTAFTALHNFTDTTGPYAGLILSANTLYGTTPGGYHLGFGTVFALKTDGTGFRTLHYFTPVPQFFPFANIDGAYPYAGLTLFGNTLYGTASGGGITGYGTVYAVNTDGTGFTNLYNFSTIEFSHINGDGAVPYASLISSSNTLYGTAVGGGLDGYGAAFAISIPVTPPQLTISPAGANVILTWPINYAGFDYTGYTLQSTTDLGSSVWTTVTPAPVIVNGQNTMTNPISGVQQFFRLSE